MSETKILLPDSDLPTHWYNVVPDMPNPPVPQAYYNHIAGIHRLTTETGAGQWGSSLALAGQLFDMAAYDRYLAGELQDYDDPEDEVTAALDHLPKFECEPV